MMNEDVNRLFILLYAHASCVRRDWLQQVEQTLFHPEGRVIEQLFYLKSTSNSCILASV